MTQGRGGQDLATPSSSGRQAAVDAKGSGKGTLEGEGGTY